MRAVREVVEGAVEAGLEVLSLFAFSQENWQRPPTEITALMSLLEEYVAREADELHQRGVRVRVARRRSTGLTPEASAAVDRVVCADGGQRPPNAQSLHLVQRACGAGAGGTAVGDGCAAAGRIDPSAIDEATFAVPAVHRRLSRTPTSLIRTSGEQRISNFLLWQLAYSELFLSPVLWPDFTRRELYRRDSGFPVARAAIRPRPGLTREPRVSELAKRILSSLVAAPLALVMISLGGRRLRHCSRSWPRGARGSSIASRAPGTRPLDPTRHRARGRLPLAVLRSDRSLSPHARHRRARAARDPGRDDLGPGLEGRPLGAAAVTVLGVLYTGGLLSFGYALRDYPYAIGDRAGTTLGVFPLVLTWASDIGAYFVGRADRRTQAHARREPGKDRRGGGGRPRGQHVVSWLYARSVLVPVASRLHA